MSNIQRIAKAAFEKYAQADLSQGEREEFEAGLPVLGGLAGYMGGLPLGAIIAGTGWGGVVGGLAGATAGAGLGLGYGIGDQLAENEYGIWNANPNGIKSGQKTLMHPVPAREEVRKANLDRQMRALNRARIKGQPEFTLPPDKGYLDVYRNTAPDLRYDLRQRVRELEQAK